MISFEGQVAVVTGAGGGLGRAYALELARRGAAVVVNDVGSAVSGEGHSSDVAQAVVGEIVAAGGTALASTTSVADPDGGAAVIDLAIRELGRVDVLVSNAGILRNAPFAQLTRDQIDGVLDVHLRGTFHVTQPAFRAMAAQRYGRIVLTSSGAGLFGHANQASYAAAKAGIFGLLRGLAAESLDADVRINAVLPIALTRLAGGAEQRAASAEHLVMGGRPELVAPLVAYLASRECAATGEAFSAFDGHFASVFVATTPGWDATVGAEPSAEDIATNLATIRDRNAAWEPTSVEDELATVTRTRMSA